MCGEVIGYGRGTSTGGGESALVVGDPAGDVGIQEGLSGGQVGGVELAGVVGLVSRAGECEGWRRGDDVVGRYDLGVAEVFDGPGNGYGPAGAVGDALCGEVIGYGRGTSTGGGESALVVGDPAGDVGIQEGLSGGQVGGVELAGVVGLVSRAGECEGWRRGDDVVGRYDLGVAEVFDGPGNGYGPAGAVVDALCGEVIGYGRGTSTGGGESGLVVGDPAGDVGIQEGLSGGQVGGVELAGVVGLVSRAGECEGWRRGDDVVGRYDLGVAEVFDGPGNGYGPAGAVGDALCGEVIGYGRGTSTGGGESGLVVGDPAARSASRRA